MSGFLEGWFNRRREKAPEPPAERLAPSERGRTSALFPDAGDDAPSAEAAPSSAASTASAGAAAGAAVIGGTLVVAASAAHILHDHDAPPAPDDAPGGESTGDASADGGHDAAPSADSWDGDFGSGGDVGSGGDD